MLLDSPDPNTPPPPPRRRTLDNPRSLLAIVVLMVAILFAIFWVPGRLARMEQELVSEVVFYALAVVCLFMLLALLFVLGRNFIKLFVERKQGTPFAHFRTKLVLAMIGLTIVPTSLVLVTGNEFLRTSADRWFSVPVDQALNSAATIASIYYRERRESAAVRAAHLASVVPPDRVDAGDVQAVLTLVRGELATMRDGIVEVYQTEPTPTGERDVVFLLAQQVGAPPPDVVRASADRLAARVAAAGAEQTTDDELPSGGVLVRAGAPVRDGAGVVVGVVVTSLVVPVEMTVDARRAINAYAQWRQMRVLSGPLQGLSIGVFLLITLLILLSATWLGFYIAKRITRPVQMLAEGARAIGEGRLDLRLQAETGDELGALVESFNTMAAELGTSRERLDARRRYIETVLERVATGVISLDAAGRVSTINGAAMRLLALDATAVGRPVSEMLAREDLRALLPLATGSATSIDELTLSRPDGEVHLAAAATTLTSAAGTPEGAVLVFDDVTPLIRTQRVAAWRDVARRLAHEIKNPLTPIRLSAERLRRNFAQAPPNARALVDECTGAIITEVDSLKGLVDEFAQFARLRGPRMAVADLNAIVADTLALYGGMLQPGALQITSELGDRLPLVRVDVEQIRQVIINLVDNAMEALGGPSAGPRPDGKAPMIRLVTLHDPAAETTSLQVIDNGPGVPAADRDKLFMPYYSTKGRGSGLGLAIVSRIISEHGGQIDVTDAVPSGTVVTVTLPAE